MHSCGTAFTLCNVFDVIPEYGPILHDLALQRTGEFCDIKAGPEHGDLLKVRLEDLEGGEIDMLKGGPPCPPWSAGGNRAGDFVVVDQLVKPVHLK